MLGRLAEASGGTINHTICHISLNRTKIRIAVQIYPVMTGQI